MCVFLAFAALVLCISVAFVDEVSFIMLDVLLALCFLFMVSVFARDLFVLTMLCYCVVFRVILYVSLCRFISCLRFFIVLLSCLYVLCVVAFYFEFPLD